MRNWASELMNKPVGEVIKPRRIIERPQEETDRAYKRRSLKKANSREDGIK